MNSAIFIDLAALPVLDNAASALVLMDVAPEGSIDVELPIMVSE